MRVIALDRRSRSVAFRMMPIWPRPESTPQNSSGFSRREQRWTSPSTVATSSSSTLSACAPCLKDATPMPAMESVPPTVTERLLVSTGGMRPWRYVRATTSRQMAPASTVTVRAASSTARMRPIDFMSSRIPPRLMASSDCEWAAPRVETVRPCRAAKRSASSTSSADDGLHHQPRPPVMDVAEVGQELVVGLGAGEDDALDAPAQLVQLGGRDALVRGGGAGAALRRAGVRGGGGAAAAPRHRLPQPLLDPGLHERERRPSGSRGADLARRRTSMRPSAPIPTRRKTSPSQNCWMRPPGSRERSPPRSWP